ncbi:sugar phosphate nucleotidyltransferase [Paenibacillus sp. IHBB 10380]|uniref:sugar phosphate nucleotidyltransferase n=1 Tax=Paenibacillus sp. IHBB 10380 TaxID=1566358 RepID=UPI0005CFD200|nr:sugar phosphate nucleotidyltransferase [Paenibacillus sp. IHBB 10380]AJS60033.1 mannose-1-phosphate guanylyltransferase [Paenibacillus sp. IHBB 10380]
MQLVLLSGGSGKRLWPLSNDSRSKQFLKVLDDPSGLRESMVQRVWRQIQHAGLEQQTHITTSKAQVEILQNQLGYGARLVVEPERRDTFPAIALAATYLYSIKGIGLKETVVVLPVDPYVEVDFFTKVKELDSILDRSQADIALIGVRPTYPSEKYGYIIPESYKEDECLVDYSKVKQFHEKPHEEEAAVMMKQAALWNCGVFAFKLDYLINLLISMNLPIQYEEMLKQYSKLTKISFDYQVVEKTKHLVVTPYEGSWKDLGTWNTLTDEMSSPILGKGVVSEDSLNTHLINELNIPVTILGLSNIIVATSPDGILVSDKEASPRIKEILKGMNNRPMYEERRWGYYQVLDYSKNTESVEVLTKRICINAGHNLSYQVHLKRREVWTIISGEGEFVLNERHRRIKQGDVLVIPESSRHSVKAIGDLEIIEVQMGSELVEEDIIRLKMEWSDIMANCI